MINAHSSLPIQPVQHERVGKLPGDGDTSPSPGERERESRQTEAVARVRRGVGVALLLKRRASKQARVSNGEAGVLIPLCVLFRMRVCLLVDPVKARQEMTNVAVVQ